MPCQKYGITRVQKTHIKSANATSLAALRSFPFFLLKKIPTPVFSHDHCTDDIFSHVGRCVCM